MLKIQYEPQIPLQEEKTYDFKCISNSNPDAYLNSTLIYIAEDRRVLSINGSLRLQMNKKLNGKTIICQNENSIGKTTINVTLNVNCKLKLITNKKFNNII